jgi:superfamily II DNA or RNA helicase
VKAADILSRIPPEPVLQKTTDIEYMNLLRPCQQKALDAMESAFKNQLGYFVLGLPPGAGKTLVCILFCMLKVAQKYNVIIIASPLCVQVAQTKKRFDALLTHCGVKFTSTLVDSDGDTSVDNVSADRKEGYVHYVHTTYKSAENVAEAITEADTVLSFIDEAQRYTAQQLACLLEITQDVVLVSGTWRSIHADVLYIVDEDRKVHYEYH